MSRPILVIGNKNYSSWSLRAWLAARHAGADFEEIRLPLDTPEFDQAIGHYSPTGRVPVWREGALVVWDSLAIGEYLAERFPRARLWPEDPARRAWARALCAEMHSGFGPLRQALPMNCRARRRRVTIGPEVAADIARVQRIWRECRAHLAAGEGPWLLGHFTLVDAFYAPVALRFLTYEVELDDTAQAYLGTVLADPLVTEWMEAGRQEVEVVAADEAGEQF